MSTIQSFKMDRVWSMPNENTFEIQPIKEFLKEEMTPGVWCDPMAKDSKLCVLNNDINPNTKADYHKDALQFLKEIDSNHLDGLLFDPPYSVRQLAECYKNVGIAVTQETTRPNFWTNLKSEITRVVKEGGKVISFGWNSGGIGKTLGFEITRIRLVPHGGIHNDTICVVEVKRQSRLDAF